MSLASFSKGESVGFISKWILVFGSEPSFSKDNQSWKDLSSNSVQCNIPTMWLPRLNLNISDDRELTPIHGYVGLTFVTTTKRLVVIFVTL